MLLISFIYLSSTMPSTTKSPEKIKNNFSLIITLAMLTLVTIVFVAGLLFFKFRRRSSKNNISRKEDSEDLLQDTATKTLTKVKKIN